MNRRKDQTGVYSLTWSTDRTSPMEFPEDLDPMADSGREAEVENYAYSFFKPADVSETDLPVVESVPPQEKVSETGPKSLEPKSSVSVVKRMLDQGKHYLTLVTRLVPSELMLQGFSNVKLMSLLGWSTISGAGAVAAVVESGPLLGLQIGALGGVWAGVSLTIWFLPARLVH